VAVDTGAEPTGPADAAPPGAAGQAVLLTLASGQFLMTLDSSVMNVSIGQVAHDVGTSITGIQLAITLYTLVMAALMITGGRLGAILGRRRAFVVGCLIYGCGSLVTALAPNLTVLIIGWSFLEGTGAALIMPAIVALVAANFGERERSRAYGLVASAGAIAVAAGPLIGGLFTTYASWRWVFAGEVLVVAVIVALSRRMAESPPEAPSGLDPVGTGLSAAGMALVVGGVLGSGTLGLVRPQPGAATWLGLSPVIWLLLGGLAVLGLFGRWELRRLAAGRPALLDPHLLRTPTLRAGLVGLLFQYLLQAGLFFVVPLYLSVALGLSAVATGVRLLPLSITLLVGAVAIPRLAPHASPRRVVRLGFGALLAGLLVLLAGLEVGSGPEITTWPMLAVTVSSVPPAETGSVGGIQNTVTNLGASIGTALAGAVLISALTTSFLTGIEQDPDVPDAVAAQAEVDLGNGASFTSDAQLEDALAAAGVPADQADDLLDANAEARIAGLRVAVALLAGVALLALFATGRLPDRVPGAATAEGQQP
jgi:MFS family permease